MRKVQRELRPQERAARKRAPLSYDDRLHILAVNRYAIGKGWLINLRVQRPDGRWWRCLRPGPQRQEAIRAVERMRQVCPELLDQNVREIERLLDGIKRTAI